MKAMGQHEVARDYYRRISHKMTHADAGETLDYLAKEAEASHKEKVANIYDTVAFPQVWQQFLMGLKPTRKL